MPIPESQLETWAHQGSITQSSTTYATVKRALEASSAPYAGTSFSTFLQGSYANDTNIYADSDVDVVIQLQSAYYSDDTALPGAMRAARRAAHQTAPYGYPEFKRHVLGRLRTAFDGDVHPGAKAVFIAGSGVRRNADVLAAVTFKRFLLFEGEANPRYYEGLCFFLPDGTRIVNYPKLHSANCTTKHQATTQWFKPTVRIFKNMRNCAVESGLLRQGMAPSYFLEGMLYNVPDSSFGRSYGATVVNCLNWLLKCGRSKLICASGQHFLLNDTSPVTWRAAQFESFLKVTINQWNSW